MGGENAAKNEKWQTKLGRPKPTKMFQSSQINGFNVANQCFDVQIDLKNLKKPSTPSRFCYKNLKKVQL